MCLDLKKAAAHKAGSLFLCCYSLPMLPYRRPQLLGALLLILAAGTCSAAPEEIQVYLDEFADPGKFGLDLHTNYVPSAQPGSITRHMLRVTPELSFGVNENFEVALYWLASAGPLQGSGAPVTDGVKARIKWRPKAPSADSPFYGAINVELGKLSRRFNADTTSAEVKFIGVYRNGPWTLGGNLNIDNALRKINAQTTTAEVDTKLAYRLKSEDEGGLQLGFESYRFLGALRNAGPAPSRTSSTFLVADFALGKWDFNVGVGKASGATADKTLVKAIIGVPLP
ncbi:hypothetical protein BH11PSE7_BH11PSE7_37980 [soil metagenome]